MDASFTAGAGYAGPTTTDGPIVPRRLQPTATPMIHRPINARPSAARGLASAALLAALWSGSAAAADQPVYFVAPSNRAPQTTVSVAAPPVAPCASQSAEAAAIDFAALASFAQTAPAAPEEIVGDPQLVDTRGFRPITQITIDAALPAGGDVPGGPGVEQAGVPSPPWPTFDDPRLWGGWAEMGYQWSATRLCHRPLYFEEVNLERYGYTVGPCLQPAISGAHFFLTIPALPYKMAAQCPRECIYTLGYYRAGSRVPRRWHYTPWDPTAVTVEGLVVTGLVFAIP